MVDLSPINGRIYNFAINGRVGIYAHVLAQTHHAGINPVPV